LTSEEGDDLKNEFVIRRAFIPRPDHCFIMIDYDAMEYKLLLDYACKLSGRLIPLAARVLDGADVHQATYDIASQYGVKISRKTAKAVNFLSLYGGGVKKLAGMLGCTEDEARSTREAVFRAAPEIQQFSQYVISSVKSRGWCKNWFGRRYDFPDPQLAYRAVNYLIQGGCADIVKIGLNNIHDALKNYKSKCILTIHDENVIEVHKSEILVVPKLVLDIMSSVYKAKYVPLTCSMEHSWKSLADKTSNSLKEHSEHAE
jgi:DNA polymerase-1